MPIYSFLTLLICLQCDDNDDEGVYVSKDVLYVPGVKVELLRVKIVVKYTTDNEKVGKCVKKLINTATATLTFALKL